MAKNGNFLVVYKLIVHSVARASLAISSFTSQFRGITVDYLALHFLQVFFGTCFNGDAVASSNLTSPVQARYLMFKPQEPLTQNENYLCMRIDVLSCQNGKNILFTLTVIPMYAQREHSRNTPN